MNIEASIIKFKRSKRTINFSIILTPLFYLVIAIFVGEASLTILGIPIEINSSIMYILFIISLLLIIKNGKIRIKRKFSIIFFFYLYIVFRSSLNFIYLESYTMPNLVTMMVLIIIYNIYYKNNNILSILDILYYFSGILIILGTFKLIGGSDERLAVFGGPNGYYKFCFLFETLSYGKFLKNSNYMHLSGIFLAILLSVATGSKGSIITFCIIIPIQIIYYLIYKNRSLNSFVIKIFKVILMIAFLGAILIFIINYNESLRDLFDRVISIFDGTRKTSIDGRKYAYSLAIQYFLSSPILGMGGDYMYYATLNTANPFPYAHNIFLEVISENGIIGMLLLLAFFGEIFYKIITTKKDVTSIILLMCIMVYFIGGQFSGNILDSKPIFFFGLLYLNWVSEGSRRIT